MTHDPTMAKDVEQTFDDDTEFHLPKEHWPLPELIHTETPHAEPTHTSFVSVAASPEYTRLRSAFRSFAFPMTIAGLTSYFAYVFLSIFATDFMARPMLGALNVGMVIGLAQFAMTWLWTALYVNYATKRLDPVSSELKARLEKDGLA